MSDDWKLEVDKLKREIRNLSMNNMYLPKSEKIAAILFISLKLFLNLCNGVDDTKRIFFSKNAITFFALFYQF